MKQTLQRKDRWKRENGVSLQSLVVAIVLVIILAGIGMYAGTRSIDEAALSSFISEIKEVEVLVAGVRMQNRADGVGEEIHNQGFYKTTVVGAPNSFASFSTGKEEGYVVDLETIEYPQTKYGKDYPRFATNPTANVVTFGRDDVYIYDANRTRILRKRI